MRGSRAKSIRKFLRAHGLLTAQNYKRMKRAWVRNEALEIGDKEVQEGAP